MENIAEPTTIVGLAGVAISAIIYLCYKFIQALEKKDAIFSNFVEERNHQTGAIIKENTEVLVKVGENIKNNTESIKQLMDIHLKK